MARRSLRKEEIEKKILEAEEFDPDFTIGLSEAQVISREKKGLANKTAKKVTKTYWQIVRENVFSFFNLVFFGIAIMLFVAQAKITYFFFLAPILCNIFLGLLADIHARRLVDKMRILTDPRATAMRGGKEVSLLPSELVLSDIIILSPGDQVPSDCVVVNGRCDMDESLLTGESDAVPKRAGDQLLSGSYVRAGKVYCRVNRVGAANYIEGLREAAGQFKRPDSELKGTYMKLFLICGLIAIFIGAVTAVTWVVLSYTDGTGIDYPSYQDFAVRFSGSLTAMIPAGLYLLTSLTLTVGVINLSQKKMNVQELYCIEMLARVDVLCFDKTGTLTDGALEVKDIYLGTKVTREEIKRLLRSLFEATGDDNGTARALRKYAGDGNSYSFRAAIPFDSSRKWSAASFPGIGTFVMGAPDIVEAKVGEELRARSLSLAKEGLRTIGLYRSKEEFAPGSLPTKLEMVALAVLSDHVKEDAKANIDWFVSNGVQVKVISGDNAMTVSRIAEECGVPNAGNYISMEDVKDEEIPQIADKYSVFGRVKPEQKAMLVEALQAMGHKVAMTGDGVNDIIALKKADCSIAMASGSSAARNASHIVSLENDFSKLPDVVAEGRRVINNLQRTASLFLSKTTFAMVLSLFFLIVSWFGGPDYPFTTTNMYVWELGAIGAGGFFLALQPTNDRLEGSFVRNIISRAVPAGCASILAVLIVYIIHFANPGFLDLETARYVAAITFSIIAYFVFFKVCLPLDLYRAIVFFGIFALALLAFGLDVGLGWGIFDLRVDGITPAHWGIIAGLSVGLGALYLVIAPFIDRWNKRKGQKA